MNKAVLAGNADKLVLVSDEVGSGIVPIDAFEREFREKNGRVNCYLASPGGAGYPRDGRNRNED